MFKSKTKGLFVDISEFSILAVQTSSYGSTMKIEQVASFSLEDNSDPEDIRAFLGNLVDLKKGNYPALCGIYPKDRFVAYHEVESGSKLRNQNYLQKVLQSDLGISLDTNTISILNAHDGSHFDPTKNVFSQLIFCGAPTTAFQEAQDRILSYGLLPKRLELSSVATLGGICNYTQLKQITSSMLFVELTSKAMHVFILSKGKVEMTRSHAFGLNSLFPILQEEMGLKDEASARKLFHSNTFDIREIGRKLLQKILKELKADIGFYEVQTGLNISALFISLLPTRLSWIAETISSSLGLKQIQVDIEAWLQNLNIDLSEQMNLSALDSQWFTALSLMAEFNSREKHIIE